jgi:DNA-binding MarR family transcriptional regulator
MRSMAKTLAHCPHATEEIHVTCIDQRTTSETSSAPGTASLLAQLGAHATARLASRLGLLELIPAHAGILKILTATPGMSQCALARALGTLPSRMVGYLDELERKDLLERRPHQSDRRNHALHLTKAGQAAYRATSRLAQEHQQALLVGLSRQQRTQLAELLLLVAHQQGLISGPLPQIAPVHQFEKRSAKTTRAHHTRRERPKESNPAICAAGASAWMANPNVPAPSHPPSADGCSSAETTERT